jgi:branched-chain amino acid transport system ATP-binding protein
MSGAAALTTEGIVKKFGGLVVLNGVSVVIPDGEIVGLIGPNGAGKTTFFNVVTGFLRPEAGEFSYYGQNATGRLPYQIARMGVSRTFQVVKPFPSLLVREGVMIGAYKNTSRRKTAEEIAAWAMDLVGIGGLAERRYGSCNLMQTKLVDLARCLATKPKMLLIDELAAGLTPAEMNELIDVLKRINRQEHITMCVVEHVIRFIMNLSNRIMVLHQGGIIAEGAPSEIVNNPAVVAAYLGESATGAQK